MARKKLKTNNKQQDRNTTIMMYARALNLHSIEEYQQWCAQHGFSTNLNKSKVQLERERQQYQRVAAIQKLKQYKREENIPHLIQKIYANEITHKDLHSEELKQVSHGFKTIKNKRLLRDVLLYLEENSKLLRYADYIKGVIGFVSFFSLWLRPALEWKPRTCNVERQFSSLARYLFAQYEVPVFMDSVWFNADANAQRWFIHLGKGNNIRTAASLPIKLTKKMAHYFVQAPAYYDINAAFRWAQIHALGGNKMIADAVAQTRLTRDFNNDNFCQSVLRFFIDNPMLDGSQYNPIIDYIWNRKFENRLVFIERGIAREEGPEQPEFSMHARTPTTLLRQVDEWHRQLGKESRGGDLQWLKSRILDFNYIEGGVKTRNWKKWTINELLSSNELIAEGRKQHHCVASYARSCFSGKTSIWTMDVQENSRADMILPAKKLLTIEVHNSTKTIRQIRGLHNRIATSSEMDIIHRWAQAAGLAIATYI